MAIFIESIKVLAVVDSTAGKSVFETNGALLQPAYLIFSVPEDLYLLLQKATYLSGTLFPVPRNAAYSNGTPKETKIVCTYIKEYILRQAVDVDVQDNKKTINAGEGISASLWDSVIGAPAIKDFEIDEPIKLF